MRALAGCLLDRVLHPRSALGKGSKLYRSMDYRADILTPTFATQPMYRVDEAPSQPFAGLAGSRQGGVQHSHGQSPPPGLYAVSGRPALNWFPTLGHSPVSKDWSQSSYMRKNFAISSPNIVLTPVTVTILSERRRRISFTHCGPSCA